MSTPVQHTLPLAVLALTLLASGCATSRAADGDRLLDQVPTIVGEHAVVLPATGEHADAWQTSGGATVEAADTPHGRDGLALHYDLSGHEQVTADLPWPTLDEAPERLRFWLHGDGSGHVMEMWVHHVPTDQWLWQTAIPLDFTGWRHMEVPAQNPLYRFHATLDRLRLLVKRGEGDGADEAAPAGRIVIGRIHAVSPRLVERELPPPTDAPAPVFTTWGGANGQHLMAGASIGVNLQQAPIDFPHSGRTIERCTRYLVNAATWAERAGITTAMTYFPGPSEEWLRAHIHLMPRNAQGQPYDRLGGTFMSPWHPEARASWENHIAGTLAHLEDTGALAKIGVMKLSPGEESEISYEWETVWAFNAHAIRAYQRYLREHYNNDLAALNADWATDYESFDTILPPHEHYPDREHWVFTDFYRLSMLRWCVQLADMVRRDYQPKYWLWLTHSPGAYPKRFYAARYPIFYTENLRRLGLIDYAQLAVLDWQSVEDVQHLRRLGVRVIGETDIIPTPARLDHLFAQCRKFGTDGVFLGILEQHSENGELTEIGRQAQELIADFRAHWTPVQPASATTSTTEPSHDQP